MRLRLLPLLLASCLSPLPAFAQVSNSDVADRMDKVERDLMTLQRQIARSGVETGAPAGDSSEAAPLPADAAQLEVRLTAIDEEIRGLRGSLEENQFQVRKLTDQLEKYQKDTDLRLTTIEQKQPPAAPAAASSALPAKPPAAAPQTPPAPPASAPEPPTGDLSKPKELYNYAFRLLNQTRYDEAAQNFRSFTEKFPKDPLIGNAYYWLGETFYIKRDYVKSADSFSQGYEAMPDGPKAADNLLKLSMSLTAMKKSKDACVVLDRLVAHYKESSPSVTQKAEQERTRSGCK